MGNSIRGRITSAGGKARAHARLPLKRDIERYGHVPLATNSGLIALSNTAYVCYELPIGVFAPGYMMRCFRRFVPRSSSRSELKNPPQLDTIGDHRRMDCLPGR